MAGFLLDVHIPLAVVDAFRSLVSDTGIEHVARWRAGALRTTSDEQILAAAAEAGLVLVTFDVSTVQSIANRWLAQGRSFPGILFIVGTAKAGTDIGSITRALIHVTLQPELFEPVYPIVFLRPR